MENGGDYFVSRKYEETVCPSENCILRHSALGKSICLREKYEFIRMLALAIDRGPRFRKRRAVFELGGRTTPLRKGWAATALIGSITCAAPLNEGATARRRDHGTFLPSYIGHSA